MTNKEIIDRADDFYKTSGFKPTRFTFHEGKKCCPIYAIILSCGKVGHSHTSVIGRSEKFILGFTYGFDSPERYIEILNEYKLTDYEKEEFYEGFNLGVLANKKFIKGETINVC